MNDSRNIIHISNKAIRDMTNIFGRSILNHSICLNTYFIPNDRMLEVVYVHYPALVIKFQFSGDGCVVIFDNDMTKLISCSCLDSKEETARERVVKILEDFFNIHVHFE